MISDAEFDSLLKRVEGETLDFKASGYDLTSDHGKFSLVKDVICLANTPRDEDSFVIMGVKRNADNTSELRGCSVHPDEADLQSQFVERVYPIPNFTYEIVPLITLNWGAFKSPLAVLRRGFYHAQR